MTAHPPYTPPQYQKDGFNCPACHAFSNQEWGHPERVTGHRNHGSSEGFAVCRCSRCGAFSTWIDKKMVYPPAVVAPPPNTDIPADIKRDYEEARMISAQSPRGAAALLRLCIQKLCKHLGESGENINGDVAALVKKGLPLKVQQALDVVRVVGNYAVHPGQIDLNDNPDVTNRLFGLVNVIAEVMISQPKQIDELYNSVVPDAQKKAIAKRDGSQPPAAG